MASATTKLATGQQEKSLRDLFCEAMQCSPEKFEERMALTCLHAPHLAKLLWYLDRDYFLSDLEMIKSLGRTTSYTECRQEMDDFRHTNPPTGILRKKLRIRVSGQAVLKLASKLFQQSNSSQEQAAST